MEVEEEVELEVEGRWEEGKDVAGRGRGAGKGTPGRDHSAAHCVPTEHAEKTASSAT